MFTGLVEELGTVVEISDQGPGKRIVIDTGVIADDAELGASIANNGCCLTVVAIDGTKLAFDADPETLKRTNIGRFKPGSRVNLERSLKAGDRLGGHFVTGHVDAVGHLDERIDDADWSTFWFRVPAC